MIYKLYFTNAFLGALNFMSIVLVTIVFTIILTKFIAAHRKLETA